MKYKTNINQNPFFSIVLTTYNREKFIISAINSLISQTYDNWECIIIDDGSADNTFSMIRNIIDNDDRFRYVFHKNKKQAYSKNVGIINSIGNYITFLDSDDNYLPNHLESRYAILKDNEIELLHGGVKIIGDEYVPNIYNINEKISIHNCVIGGTFFIKNSLVDKIGLLEIINYGDDTSFFKKALNFKAVIAKTTIQTYVYNRLSEDSICKNINK